MKPLYIIPARGGSKGIPHKNIKLLGNKPLIYYAIEAAKRSVPGYILLSTDDEQIAEVGRDYGLTVDYMRPAALATDTSGSREVIIDAMDWADSKNIEYDCVVLLQPTSPFRTADDIDKCLDMFTPDIDMVVSVMPARTNPYYNSFETQADGFLMISKGDGMYTRRQDAPKVYEYNGAVYVINPASIRACPMGSFKRRVPYPMDAERSIDLDTPLDWLVAESLLNKNNNL